MKRWFPLAATILILCFWFICSQGQPKVHGKTEMGMADGCSAVPNTPHFTIAYGTVQLDGAAAPVGAIVKAKSPRGDLVGCFEVNMAGNYGAMYVYGEDTTAIPPIPGMRDGETVQFFVNDAVALASPVLVWHNDWASHAVTLTSSSPTPTPTSSATPTFTPTPTSNPTPTSTPTTTWPDLIVQRIQAQPSSPAVKQTIAVTVTIKNQGSGPVSGLFYTDVYADHNPTGCNDVGWDYRDLDALSAGEVVTLSFTHPGFATAGVHSIYAQVDSACQVAESNETNNVYGPLRVQVTNPVAPPIAGFWASPVAGMIPLTVTFTSTSTGQITSWLWLFGDGHTSAQPNPVHIYT
ncbi:MAG: PKD domain-containing protein, partial [Fimbriimonadales bacterium]|nr:PKD domain-containing protein [Fimbriimonadales bacterium]